MDGFTSSLHVRGATAKRVQQAVTDLLSAEGFQVATADEEWTGSDDQPITRGLWIAKTKGDWVTLFCSDFLFQQEIGRELSRRLKTYTLNVWVSEGSSWHYSLFHDGEEVDQFDSTGDIDELQEFLDNDMEELAAEFDDGDVRRDNANSDSLSDELPDPASEDLANGLLDEEFARFAELREQLISRMPPDVREIYDRLNEGQASLGDMRKFDLWSQSHQAELNRYQDELQQRMAQLSAAMQGGFEKALDTGAQAAPAELPGNLPPDIAELVGKMLSGNVNGDDLRRLNEQIEALEDEPGEAEEEVEEMSFFAPSPGAAAEDEFDEEDFEIDSERQAITEQQLQMHLGALRPLLRNEDDADEIAETLTNQEELPEEPLGEFLSLLGIEGNMALLDFDSLENISDADLKEQGIKLSPLLLVRSS